MKNRFDSFQQVLVRDNQHMPWACSFYSHYDETLNMHMCINGCGHVDCIPYHGNEELTGTTDNPKQKTWRAEKGETYWYVSVDSWGVHSLPDIERGATLDDMRYNSFNYFKTQQESDGISDEFKKILTEEKETIKRR